MRKKTLFISVLVIAMLTGCARNTSNPIGSEKPVTTEDASTIASAEKEETPAVTHNPEDPIEGCYEDVASKSFNDFCVQVDDMVFAPGITTMRHAMEKIEQDGRYEISTMSDDNRSISAISIYKSGTLYCVIQGARVPYVSDIVVGKINPINSARNNCWISGGYCMNGDELSRTGCDEVFANPLWRDESGTYTYYKYIVNGTDVTDKESGEKTYAAVRIKTEFKGEECKSITYEFIPSGVKNEAATE